MSDHGGHRPTPRLNTAIQKYFKVPEEMAGEIISAHRSGQEYLGDDHYKISYPESAYSAVGGYDPNKHGHPDDDNIGKRVDFIPQAISEAISTRHGKDSRGYSSPYERPPTVESW